MFCKKCGRYQTYDKCYCKEYEVFNEDLYGDEPKLVFAMSEEDAIEKLADRDYWSDPCEPSDYEFVGIINGKTYKVTAEAVVNFNVDEL